MMPMSAGSYNSYADPAIVPSEIARQMTYYFSLENLLKDMFLRSHMDSQGFVALSLIANFKKMKELTTDLEFIKSVCLQLGDLEMRVGLDGQDRLRKKDGWETFVLSMDKRVPEAKHDGPPSSNLSTANYYPHLFGQSLGSPSAVPAPSAMGPVPSFSPSVSSFVPLPITPAINGFHSSSSPQNGPVPKVEQSQTNGHDYTSAKYQSVKTQSSTTAEEVDSHHDHRTQDLKVFVPAFSSQSQQRAVESEASRISTDELVNGAVIEEQHSGLEPSLSRSRSRQNGNSLGYEEPQPVDPISQV